MKILKSISREKFLKDFSTTEECLANIKRAEGYQCSKCSETNYIKGKQHASRRCKKCGNDESATAHTLFIS